MKPNKQDIQIWIDALRSGQYEQTKGTLQNKHGYCCLGVACTLFIKKLEFDGNYLLGGLPEDHYNAPLWLKRINRDFKIKTDFNLSAINDQLDMTFGEIADVLEAVYILEVLD